MMQSINLSWAKAAPIHPKYEVVTQGVKAIVDYDPNWHAHEMYKPRWPIEYKWRWHTYYGRDFSISRGDGHGRAATPEEAMRQAESWIEMFKAEKPGD